MKKLLCIVLAALTVAFCFAACSKNTTTDETTTAAPTEAAGETAKVKVVDIDLSEEEYAFGVDKKQPELLEKTNAFIKEIKENGKFNEICDHYFAGGTPVAVTPSKRDTSKDQLLVATNAAFEPFEYKKGKSFYGIDMEIAQLLADYLGKELVILDMEFDAVLLSVQQGKADIGMAGLTVKPDRKKLVNFTDSYYEASQKLIVKGDDTTFDECKTADDVYAILSKLDATTTIGGQNGTTGQLYVQGDKDFEFKGLKATFKGYSNGSLAVQDLINGGVQYVIIDSAPATAITTAINSVA